MKKIFLFVSLFVLLLTSCTITPGGGTIPTTKKYTVSFDSHGGTEVSEQVVEEGKLIIEPKDPIKENYDFICWEYNNERYDFNTPVKSNITLVAKWEEKDIHVHNLIYHEKKEPTCTEIGCEEYVECSECTYSTYRELPALDHDLTIHEAKEPTDKEIGWKEYVTCSRCEYNTYEELPIIKIDHADLEVYEENGYRYTNYGSYPQTHVNDEELLNELNNLTQTNERGYYEFEGYEYSKIVTDIALYKPTDKYGNLATYSSGGTIQDNKKEWFKVEPIKWRILSDENGQYQVISEYILTAQQYYKDKYYRHINGEDINPNNYKYSDIRAFLNNEFINTAFTVTEKNRLNVSEVKNGSDTTFTFDGTNKYACEDTYDKIYLLSYQDVISLNYGFSADSNDYDKTRRAKVTDYAKATSVWWNTDEEYLDMGYWWLRSPSCYNHNCNFHVIYVPYYGFVGISGHDVSNMNYGVRPAITILF